MFFSFKGFRVVTAENDPPPEAHLRSYRNTLAKSKHLLGNLSRTSPSWWVTSVGKEPEMSWPWQTHILEVSTFLEISNLPQGLGNHAKSRTDASVGERGFNAGPLQSSSKTTSPRVLREGLQKKMAEPSAGARRLGLNQTCISRLAPVTLGCSQQDYRPTQDASTFSSPASFRCNPS